MHFPAFFKRASAAGVLAALALGASHALAAPSTTMPSAVGSLITNDGATGTTINKLAKFTSAGNAVITSTSDTDGAIGIVSSDAGTTGKAQIESVGIAKCVFDAGTVTAGHFVQISGSVAGACKDAGATRPTSGGQIIGIAQAGGAGSNTYAVQLQLTNQGGTGAAPGGSLGNLQTNNGSGGFGAYAGVSAVAHQWISALTASGAGTQSQPACADISDASTFCNGTSAANLTGTLNSSRLAWNGAVQANAQPTNPTGTTSSAVVMMGLGATCKITPSFSTRVAITVIGLVANSASGHAAGIRLYQGTGTAPTNGAAIAGNALINPIPFVPTSGGTGYAFTVQGLATGLSVGVPIWYDIALNTDGTGTASATNLTCNANEF